MSDIENSKKNKDKKTLVLLDAHAIIHRAYHALPEFLSSAGEPTGALYGLATMLMRIIGELKPDYIAACYDLPGKTFRHEAYDGYKAKRVKADDALVAQLKNSREIFEAFGIPIYDAPGFEADDVIGSIVEKFKNKDTKIIIASGDMDTMQLVDDKKVQVYTLRKGLTDTVLYDEEKVLERFGFPPKFLPDFKGLRGDPSDNIVGIKGIGEKTATDLVKKFGTIEEIYKNLSKKIDLSPRMLQLLKDGKENARFSKTLAKIRTDAPVKFNLPEKTFWQGAEPEKIEQVFAKFEFRSLFARIRKFFGENGQEASLPLPKEKEKVEDKKLKEASIALWLLNSDLPNPNLEDVLLFARTDSFEKAHQYVFEKLKERKLDKVYEEIERPIVPVVEEMEKTGILIDQEYLKKLSAEYHRELDKLVKKIYRLAGTEFNINSPKQLAEVLFQKLGLRTGGRTGKGGAYSTKVEVLEELAESSPVAREIMSYRELQKLLSTYVDVIPKMTGPDGRLHAKFLQNGTTTGRFSSQDPNLQNLPIKSELGKRIRGGFISPPGAALAAFDYSQVELRVAAMLSGDAKMTKIFKEGKDIHAGVASFVFGVPIERVNAEMRRRAKVINFGIIYGMGVSALKKNLGGPPGGQASTREEAQKFYDNYFRQFTGLKEYLEGVKTFAIKNSYTETLFGRRRHFPNINSRIPFLKNMAERTATNAPLQGTAADIIKLAIRFAHEDLKSAGLAGSARLVLVVHDELVYEIDQSVLSQAEVIIRRAMEAVLPRSYIKYKTDVPLLVHFGAGRNLGEVK